MSEMCSKSIGAKIQPMRERAKIVAACGSNWRGGGFSSAVYFEGASDPCLPQKQKALSRWKESAFVESAQRSR